MKRFRIFSSRGTRWIIVSVVLAIFLYFQSGLWLAVPFLVTAGFLALYFYDPVRDLPSHPLAVMSPVDGIVKKVGTIHDPFLGRPALRISIKASMVRVYQARSPTEGKLMEYWPAVSEDRNGYRKERVKGAWWIQTDEGDDVIMVVQSRSVFGRTFCRVQAGERIGQSRRCGRFPVLCDVDILVHEKAFIKVEEGQAVEAGCDSLAMFNHDAASTGQATTQVAT